MVPYILSVSMITGVVIDGRYTPIETIAELDELSLEAYKIGTPLLLEIETWRHDPQNIRAPMEQVTTAFYRVMPSPSEANMADHPGRDDLPAVRKAG